MIPGGKGPDQIRMEKIIREKIIGTRNDKKND